MKMVLLHNDPIKCFVLKYLPWSQCKRFPFLLSAFHFQSLEEGSCTGISPVRLKTSSFYLVWVNPGCCTPERHGG